MAARSSCRSLAAAGLALCAVLYAAAAPAGSPRAELSGLVRPWLNTAESPWLRAAQLVARMTLAEKIAELHGIQDSQHRRFVPGIPRLGVPAFKITNGPAGVGPGDDPVQQPATAFAAPLSTAATWDTGSAYREGTLAGSEAADLGNSVLEAPDINIARAPLGGRTFEGYGEDPFLTGQLAVANIRGIQHTGVIAEVKHFAANNQETDRRTINEVIDNRTLHEIYLPQFEAAVHDGRPGALMCAYPKINGQYACQNTYLLRNVLRWQWHYQGFVQSDFGATHSTTPSAAAGLDLQMPTGSYYADAMKLAIQAGQVSLHTIDALLIRRFTVMIRYGLFDHPRTTSSIPAAPDGAVARQLADEGAVLLRNQNGQLPLDAQAVRSVAVIGPYAGAAMTGGGGSSHVDPLYTVSPVQGIKNQLPGATVRYDSGGDPRTAAALASRSDVAVVMVGETQTEGADRSTLALPGNQDQLIESVAAANPHTIVVIKSGGAVLMPWLRQVPAVLEVWYPGEEDGNVVADLLFGHVNPSGKLPLTFPASGSQTPVSTPKQFPGVDGTVTYSERLQVGYRWYDAHQQTPLFPFGYGLSYTTFRFSNLHVSSLLSALGQVTVNVDVTNTGQRAGAEVAQLYVTDPSAAGEPPLQLKGFQRLQLAAHQTKQLQFQLGPSAFSIWKSGAQTWATVPGRYILRVGDSSANLPLAVPVTIG